MEVKTLAIRYYFKGYKQTETMKKALQRRLNDCGRTICLSEINGSIAFHNQGPFHQVICQLQTKSGTRFQLETNGSSPRCVSKRLSIN